tara:strand:+ start:2793 stop:2894 length:102 start_codon:yes stop_codon:yes gene_type:complete
MTAAAIVMMVTMVIMVGLGALTITFTNVRRIFK